MRVTQYQYIYIYTCRKPQYLRGRSSNNLPQYRCGRRNIYIYIHTYLLFIIIYTVYAGSRNIYAGAGLTICRSKDTGDGIYMREARISTRAQYQQSAAIRAGDAIRVFINRGIYAGAGRRGTKIPYQSIKKRCAQDLPSSALFESSVQRT